MARHGQTLKLLRYNDFSTSHPVWLNLAAEKMTLELIEPGPRGGEKARCPSDQAIEIFCRRLREQAVVRNSHISVINGEDAVYLE